MGSSINKFHFRKAGKAWEGVLEPTAAVAGIDPNSIKRLFLNRAKRGKLFSLKELELRYFTFRGFNAKIALKINRLV